jgi:hypothetical protein
MLVDDVDDLKVERLFLLRLLLSQSVGFFIPICHFMMEIDFFSELGEILISNIFINLISHFVLDGVDFDFMFNLIDVSISIKVVFWVEACRILRCILILHHKLSVVFVVNIILES